MCEPTSCRKGLMVTAEQAAEVLGPISAETIKREFDKGNIPGKRVGSIRLIRRSWLDTVTGLSPEPEASTT